MKNVYPFTFLATAVVFSLLLPSSSSADAIAVDYPKILSNIKSDLAARSGEFPQLLAFPDNVVLNATGLSLTYSFHTHQSRQTGGWTAGVPNPDDDGIWLYIDFHDPHSSAQIHTQPMTLPLCLGSKKVSFLLIEGKNTKSVNGVISSILRSNGVSDCRKAE